MVFLSIGSYLPAQYYTVWADCLTKPFTEDLSKCLQALQDTLRWVYSAILITDQTGNMPN